MDKGERAAEGEDKGLMKTGEDEKETRCSFKTKKKVREGTVHTIWALKANIYEKK